MKVPDYWRDCIDAYLFAIEAQCVVTLRVANFASWHPHSAAESHRMLTEKVFALSDAHVAGVTSFLNGNDPLEMMRSALLPIRRRVRENHRRLLRASA